MFCIPHRTLENRYCVWTLFARVWPRQQHCAKIRAPRKLPGANAAPRPASAASVLKHQELDSV